MREIPDIHMSPGYVRSFEAHENAVMEEFVHDCADGCVQHIYLRRGLAQYPGYEAYSDIFTAYGYGGPVALRCAPQRREALVAQYKAAFDDHCARQGIICSFARFNPVLGNAADFAPCYDAVEAIRKIVIIDLAGDPYMQEFWPDIRRRMRKAFFEGMEVHLDPHCEQLDTFLEVYRDTMDRNHAKPYYYFDRAYFEGLIAENPGQVHLAHAQIGGQVIASTLLLRSGETLYSQFAGTRRDCYHYNGSTILQGQVALEYAKLGCTRFVLGGGNTNDPDDSLLHYKQKFSRRLYDFHTGRRVYDRPVYEALCAAVQGDLGFFPAYRKKS